MGRILSRKFLFGGGGGGGVFNNEYATKILQRVHGEKNNALLSLVPPITFTPIGKWV